MKKLISLFAVASSLAWGYEYDAQTYTLFPYQYSIQGKSYSRDKDVTGISVSIVQRLLERTGDSYTLTLRNPETRILDRVKDYEESMGIGMPANPSYDQFVNFIGPVFIDDLVLVARQETEIITLTTLSDAAGWKIVVDDDLSASAVLSNANVTFKSSNYDKNLAALQSGDAELWFTLRNRAKYLASQNGIPGIKFVYSAEQIPFYLVLNRKLPAGLSNRLESEISKMKEEGEIDQMIREFLQ